MSASEGRDTLKHKKVFFYLMGCKHALPFGGPLFKKNFYVLISACSFKGCRVYIHYKYFPVSGR